jgi:hypothetical protein
LDTLRQDLRFAFRLLWKDRAFALTTLLTLALCIGANTAIFTVVRSVLLRPLPYPEADRLVFSVESFPGAGVERAGTSVPNYFDSLALTDVFESQALYRFGGFRVGQERSLNPRRTPMLLSLAFGIVALLLASVGIYGVLAYQVGQRTREIGIRMALGSDGRGIMRLVLGEGLVLVLVGLTAGMAGALGLRGLIASQLYGIGPLDPIVILAVTGVLTLASLAACLGPARRAGRVDPATALRA